jgi:hypothetical protein
MVYLWLASSSYSQNPAFVLAVSSDGAETHTKEV